MSTRVSFSGMRTSTLSWRDYSLVPLGLLTAIVASTASGQTASTGTAQPYPHKPIRIVTAEPGGGLDIAARIIAQGMSANLGQPVVIDNRGGSVAIPTGLIAKAPADGYSILFNANGFWSLPFMQAVAYDIAQDFLPVTLAASSPTVLVVHPSVAAASVKELIALAKSKPGELNYGSAGGGSTNHLTGELFKAMAGVSMVHVAYKGSTPALNGLIGGQVQLMFPTVASADPQVKAGKLRALAVTSSQTSALAPALPTVAASGLPGFEAASVQGMWVPARTSSAIVSRLHEEVVRVINRPDVKERFFRAGLEVVASSPPEFSAWLKVEIARTSKLIKDAGIRTE